MRTFLYMILPILLLMMTLQTMKAQERPEDVTEHFFQLFETKGVDEAVDYIFSTNKWLVSEKTSAETVKMQLKKGIAIIGQYYGYELVEKRMLGESYAMLSYMLRYDRQPIKFTFILYKPNKTWLIQNMKPDDRMEDDLLGEPEK